MDYNIRNSNDSPDNLVKQYKNKIYVGNFSSFYPVVFYFNGICMLCNVSRIRHYNYQTMKRKIHIMKPQDDYSGQYLEPAEAGCGCWFAIVSALIVISIIIIIIL